MWSREKPYNTKECTWDRGDCPAPLIRLEENVAADTSILERCEGGCDTYRDKCGDGLVCFLTYGKNEAEVPGCEGEAIPGLNYCSLPTLFESDKSTHLSEEIRGFRDTNCLGRCEGDCNNND